MYIAPLSLKKIFVPQRQRRLWLISSMREWHSLLHWLQVWQVGMTPEMGAFRLALFSLAVVRMFSSPDFNYLQRTLCHLLRSAAASSQLSLYTILKTTTCNFLWVWLRWSRSLYRYFMFAMQTPSLWVHWLSLDRLCLPLRALESIEHFLLGQAQSACFQDQTRLRISRHVQI